VVAIVGTRKASEAGKSIAYEFARHLSRNGCIIVSGLALGIDTAAHRGVLDENGVSWAVLAHGLDSVYPSSNAGVAQKIIELGGCLISEYPAPTPPYANQFVVRNRIISGLSDAVIIVEAPKESGALATAQFAIKQKKPIFVVPGNITSNLYSGSHRLIREGARLVTKPADILEDLKWDDNTTEKTANPLPFENGTQRRIFDIIKSNGNSVSVDKICEITKLNPRDISAALMQMTFEGLVVDDGGKYRISKIQ
jgi:DNA processing protein